MILIQWSLICDTYIMESDLISYIMECELFGALLDITFI